MLKQQHVPYRMQLMDDGYIEPSTLQNDQNSNPGLLQLAVCVCVCYFVDGMLCHVLHYVEIV